MIEIINRDLCRFERLLYKTDSCWYFVGRKNDDGYGCFDHRFKTIMAHRFAFMLYKNVDPGDLLVCHTCDIPNCCNPDHLFLGTKKINCVDSVDKGRHSSVNLFGAQRPNSKLTDEKVLKIRYMRTLGYTYDELGKAFGVDFTTIAQVVKRKTWRHI